MTGVKNCQGTQTSKTLQIKMDVNIYVMSLESIQSLSLCVYVCVFQFNKYTCCVITVYWGIQQFYIDFCSKIPCDNNSTLPGIDYTYNVLNWPTEGFETKIIKSH